MSSSLLAQITHTLRNILIRAVICAIQLVYPLADALFKRLHSSPGIPVPDPSTPYWTLPPAPIARHGSDAILPKYADIVIIGSGITGTSFARTVLDHHAVHNSERGSLQVVMLEARDTCSGATGRNGGHITPILYQEYADLKAKHGHVTAQKIIRFRLSHISELLFVAREENLVNDSQCREVEAFDVFHDETLFCKAKDMLKEYKIDMPLESANYKVYEGREQMKNLQLAPSTVGCFSTRAGSVHVYRLVTGTLKRLLCSYKSNFHLFSHTPCTKINTPDPFDHYYTVTTPKGQIRTPHIIHATNGWASHLLPGMRGKIFPARGVMTAQIPREGLGEASSASTETGSSKPWTGTRSFVFYPNNTVGVYDYLTQQLLWTGPSSYPQPRGELMLGGGFARALVSGFGNADDRGWDPQVSSYLARALGNYFSVKTDGEKEEREDVKATWSGILGISADERPWVGRVPEGITRRSLFMDGSLTEGVQGESNMCSDTNRPIPLGVGGLAPPGEWIAAGYSGEGMVHAWMSGKALAYMVLHLDESTDLETTLSCEKLGINGWFPDVFRVTMERWKNAEIEDLIASYVR